MDPELTRQLDRHRDALANSACCARAGSPRTLTIRNEGESHSDLSMVEVDPFADVPRANLLRVCKRLQPGRKPTNTENSTDDGKRNYASV
jgi:hypothetical protein